MKGFRFIKTTQQGNIDGLIRIIGKYIHFKYNSTPQTDQALEEFKKKGISFKTAKGWIQIDLIGNNESIRLGEELIDTNEDSNEQIEIKLYKFYKSQYEKMGFFIDEGDSNAVTN